MSLDETRYAVIRGLLDAARAKEFYDYALFIERLGQADNQVPGAASFYGNRHAEKLLEELRPAIEVAVGYELSPTYAFFRVYRKHDVLEPHLDRPACEVSATVCMGFDSEPWSIFVRPPGQEANELVLQPGDAAVYLGMEVEHWREAFHGLRQVNVFLHYVKADGDHKDEVFDGRGTLNTA